MWEDEEEICGRKLRSIYEGRIKGIFGCKTKNGGGKGIIVKGKKQLGKGTTDSLEGTNGC